MLSRRDLVKAAINHQTAPRIPYLVDFCPDAWAQICREGLDEGKSQEAFLDNDVEDIAVPWWTWRDLGPDWAGEEFPSSPASCIGYGSYQDLREGLKKRRQESDKYFLVRIYGSHFERAYFARGIENFLADMAGESREAKKFLTKIIDRNMVMLENFLSLPEIDGVLLGSDWGSQIDLLMSLNTWLDLIQPGEQREYDLIHGYGKDVWVHSCGNITRLLPSLVEMGLDVLNPIQPEAMDIAALKRDFGGKLTFWGGVSTQQTLPNGSPSDVRAEARGVRELLSAGGGYILGPAQSIQGDVPTANILAFLEVAREVPSLISR